MSLAFDPRQAIDYRLDIFHVWNKDKGELTINMKKHVILLTVGSDKYTVDGKTKELGYKLPVDRRHFRIFRSRNSAADVG